jgi:hypothetical protein
MVVLLSKSNCPTIRSPDSEFREYLRHEFAHVVSSQYDLSYPLRHPGLKGEGLAVFLQWFAILPPGDYRDLQVFRPSMNRSLSELHKDSAFFDRGPLGTDYRRVWDNYWTAGSFTEFMVFKYGWNQYWMFYCKSNPRNFEQKFVEFFGESLSKLEQHRLRESLPVS